MIEILNYPDKMNFICNTLSNLTPNNYRQLSGKNASLMCFLKPKNPTEITIYRVHKKQCAARKQHIFYNIIFQIESCLLEQDF